MVLVAGFNRWRAISEINKRGIWKDQGKPEPYRVRCSFTEMTEKQAFLSNIAENQCRNATTPMDDAYNIQRLVNVYEMSRDEVAKAYGMSLSWVAGRLDLIEATPAVEKQIRAGKIKGPQARTIAKLSKEHQTNLAALAEKQGNVTPADVRREVGASEPSAKPQSGDEKISGGQTGEFYALAIELARAGISEDLTPTDFTNLCKRVLAAAGLKA